MNTEIRSKFKELRELTDESSQIKCLDEIINLHRQVSEDWTQWNLIEFVRSCDSVSNKVPVAHKYAEQFILHLIENYLSYKPEHRDIEMFSLLVSSVFSFKNTSLYRMFFEYDDFITDWFVTDIADFDSNFMIEETYSDKFIIMQSAIETGTKYLNIALFHEIEKFRDNMSMFVGVIRRTQTIYNAIIKALTPVQKSYLVKNEGYIEFLYSTENYKLIKHIYDMYPAGNKPTLDWHNILNSPNVNDIIWCIKNVMKYEVASKHKKLSRFYLSKIFKFRKAQKVLYNDPDYSYAIPEMIEYAMTRTNHMSLCEEFRDVLGYNESEDIHFNVG